MSDIFCIISAIGVDYGVYSYQERLKQLIETIQSVKKYKPGSYICLMEVSDVPLKPADAQVLELLVDRIFLLHNHKFVKEILVNLNNTDTNKSARKTIGEMIGFLEFLGWLRQQDMQFDRVFKLSGRLKLNDNFQLIDYSKMQDKIVISKRWWHDRYAYTIQLWSFDFKILETMFNVFLEIWQDELKLLQEKSTLEIVETMLYKSVVKHNIPVEEIDGYIGVEGNHGQDGAEVYV